MAEQTFKSPGFFDTETVTERRQNLKQVITTVPAGIIGFSQKGPAFTPITIHSYARFVEIFGEANTDYPSTLAVKKFLENSDALTFVRVLGGGANSTSSHFLQTERFGIVQNAGFEVTSSGPVANNKFEYGGVQFICAEHTVVTDEASGYPMFASNNYSMSTTPNLVRGVLLTTTGSKFTTINHNRSFDPTAERDFNGCLISAIATDEMYDKFKLILSCVDNSIGTVDGVAGARMFSASLNPSSDAYLSNILNTDPSRFQAEKHLLYLHFPVENEIATVTKNASSVKVALLSGSAALSTESAAMYSTIFGSFNARYASPKTTKFISQPFGSIEYDLFHFECIDDGTYANDSFKISVSNIRKSDNDETEFPTFDIELRDKRDMDTAIQIIERYVDCNLDPESENFVANKIGDMRLSYNFDAETSGERRLVLKGTYPNKSSRIRIVMSDDIVTNNVPDLAAPFGFRGLPVIKTNNEAPQSRHVDLGQNQLSRFDSEVHYYNESGAVAATTPFLTGSILPPVPMRFKITTGEYNSSPSYIGESSIREGASKALYWGVKFEKIPTAAAFTNPITRPNESNVYNELLDNMSKFAGIQEMDALMSGSGADDLNHNKFTLARVGLGKFLFSTETLNDYAPLLTGSIRDEMANAAYIRSGSNETYDYTIVEEGVGPRLTLASLFSLTSSIYFNRYSNYAKFTNMFYGGFDGVNILDSDMAVMNDKASSSDAGGKGVDAPNVGLNMSFGTGDSNQYVNSYKEAVNILTDKSRSNINILAIPGIRSDELIKHTIDKVEEYGKALYLIDIPHYDANSNRLYDDSTAAVNVTVSIEEFGGRNYDTSYAAAYFPDVVVEDNGKRASAPATVAALSAIAYTDSTSHPWFAPAGFDRASLEFVKSAKVRLNKANRDHVYESRINPIAKFPKTGYVIFGQKTLQKSRTSLDRINVRRMILEAKRVISNIGMKTIFEANTPETRSAFRRKCISELSRIQENQGIEKFNVIVDATNNTSVEIENNTMRGRMIIVPTRTIEFIAVDFVLSNSGIDFI